VLSQLLLVVDLDLLLLLVDSLLEGRILTTALALGDFILIASHGLHLWTQHGLLWRTSHVVQESSNLLLKAVLRQARAQRS